MKRRYDSLQQMFDQPVVETARCHNRIVLKTLSNSVTEKGLSNTEVRQHSTLPNNLQIHLTVLSLQDATVANLLNIQLLTLERI
jgi:hypothetical protein